jgi:hypothetical protein
MKTGKEVISALCKISSSASLRKNSRFEEANKTSDLLNKRQSNVSQMVNLSATAGIFLSA